MYKPQQLLQFAVQQGNSILDMALKKLFKKLFFVSYLGHTRCPKMQTKV